MKGFSFLNQSYDNSVTLTQSRDIKHNYSNFPALLLNKERREMTLTTVITYITSYMMIKDILRNTWTFKDDFAY